MSKVFNFREERRYTDHPRRYTNEYHIDSRRVTPDVKGRCVTLHSARARAVLAVDQGFCTTVRIFDHRTGQYRFTYKQSVHGAIRHEGYVK